MTKPILAKGARGLQVYELQRKLIRLGKNLGKTGADGRFGDLTFKAVQQFQGEQGLERTGAVDDATLEALSTQVPDISSIEVPHQKYQQLLENVLLPYQPKDKVADKAYDQLMTYGDAVHAVAVSQIGKRETRENVGREILPYHRVTNTPPSAAAKWCNSFASFCTTMAANQLFCLADIHPNELVVKPSASVPTTQAEFDQNGAFVSARTSKSRASYTPQRGDYVFFHIPDASEHFYNHIGIVDSYDPVTQTLKTIEGNVRGRGNLDEVARREYGTNGGRSAPCKGTKVVVGYGSHERMCEAKGVPYTIRKEHEIFQFAHIKTLEQLTPLVTRDCTTVVAPLAFTK